MKKCNEFEIKTITKIITREDIEAKLIHVFNDEKYINLFPITMQGWAFKLGPASTELGSVTRTLIEVQTQAILDLIQEKLK